MAERLPVYNLPRFLYRITLGETKYTLTFRFNTVAEKWYIDIRDESEATDILLNLRLVYGINLLEPFQHILSGELIVVEPATVGDSNGDGLTDTSFTGDDDSRAIISFDADAIVTPEGGPANG